MGCQSCFNMQCPFAGQKHLEIFGDTRDPNKEKHLCKSKDYPRLSDLAAHYSADRHKVVSRATLSYYPEYEYEYEYKCMQCVLMLNQIVMLLLAFHIG